MTVIETRVQMLTALAISPDGGTLAAVGYTSGSGLWSLPDGGLVRRMPELDRASGLGFTPDGRRLVAVTNTGVVEIDRRFRVTVAPPVRGVAAAAPSGRTVLTCASRQGDDGRPVPGALLRRFDRSGGRSGWRERWATPVDSEYLQAAVGSAGRFVAHTAGGVVAVRDGRTGELVRELPAAGVVGVRFDGGRLLAFSRTHLWAWQPGRWDRPPLEVYGGPRERLDAVAVHPDRRRAFATNFDTSVLVIDLESGHVGRTMDWRVPLLGTVAVSPDGTLAAAANHGGTVVVWDVDE